MSIFRKEEYFSAEEKQRIVNAIKSAEQQTSGEVRVYIEKRCRFVDALDRAAELFWGLKMDLTKERNGVLEYLAYKDRQFAILADQGMHQKVGDAFWQKEVEIMTQHFKQEHPADAIEHVVNDIGKALHTHFPYDKSIDKNELTDDIIFGK
jgi:uncharacterized membrane protein